MRPSVVALPFLAITLSACAGTSTPAADATSPAPATAVPNVAASPSPVSSPSPTAAASDQTVTITYAAGKVSGVPVVVKVKHNSRVALIVTSDVADEVHVHGYDKSADVAKGGTVRILFTADVQGRFEVELEHLKRRLVVLQVQ